MADLFRNLEGATAGATEPLETVLDAIAFDADGLVPAIAQDVETGEVLMLAWMNREAVLRTLRERRASYYSRSRQAPWQKGETSGHVQDLEEMRFDCDGDAILLRVRQAGPACHTNRRSCFYLEVDGNRVRVISEPL